MNLKHGHVTCHATDPAGTRYDRVGDRVAGPPFTHDTSGTFVACSRERVVYGSVET